jgi:hypothetical protein
MYSDGSDIKGRVGASSRRLIASLTFSSPPPMLPYRKASTTGQMYSSLGNTNRILMRIDLQKHTGIYTEIANTKQGHMGKNRFENVIAEFAPKFENLKPLARELRSALFPIRDRDIFTRTFHDNDIMYAVADLSVPMSLTCRHRKRV